MTKKLNEQIYSDDLIKKITELEEKCAIYKKQLIQSEKMASLGTLAAGIAHELNNPLTGIIGYSNLLQSSENLDEEDKSKLELVLALSYRMADTVKSLLELSHKTSDNEKEPISITQSLELMKRIHEKNLSLENIELNISYDEDGEIFVLSAHNLLENIFQNLISNSRDAYIYNHIFLNRKIDIKVESSIDEEVVISYTDYAGGIPENVINRIFEPFFTTKDVGVGTGLGLSLVKQIITDLEGDLTVDVVAGRSTTFKIKLPKYRFINEERRQEISKILNLDAMLVRKSRILVIDDEPFICDFLKDAFKNDFEVITEVESIEALKKMANDKFDIVLTDLKMPGISGDKIADIVKKNFPLTTLIIMSGHAAATHPEELKGCEPYLFISKPFPKTDELIEKILLYHHKQREKAKKKLKNKKVKKVA